MSEQEPYEFYFAKTDWYIYHELDINEEELYSNVKKKIDIKNANIFDLLKWRFDFENLDLCNNFYNNEHFLVKIELFCEAVARGMCLPRNIYLDIQSVGTQIFLWNTFLIVNSKLNNLKAQRNWFCCDRLIKINAGRLSL